MRRPAGARAKQKHHPGCFFFDPALGAGTGPEQNKNTTQGVCVCVLFLLRPRRKAGEGEASLGAGTGPEQKKKNTQGVFVFFAAAPTKGRGRWTPRPFGGARTKKNHDPGCVFGPAPLGGRGRRTARAFLFVLVLLFRAWCYWFLEFCLLSSSGVQSFFCCCAPLGASFLAGPEQTKTLPTVFRLLLRPLLGYTTFRRRRSPCVTGLELFFAARFGRPGVFCLSRTVGLRYFPAGPEEKQQNDNIVFESPWCFCLNALKFCFPLDSTTFRRGSSKGKKNETPV